MTTLEKINEMNAGKSITVRELIKKLSRLKNQDAKIMCFSTDCYEEGIYNFDVSPNNDGEYIIEPTYDKDIKPYNEFNRLVKQYCPNNISAVYLSRDSVNKRYIVEFPAVKDGGAVVILSEYADSIGYQDVIVIDDDISFPFEKGKYLVILSRLLRK